MNILITGASSGFGKLIVTDLVKAGHRVVGSLRDIAGRNAAAAAGFKAMGVDVGEIAVTGDASGEAGVAQAAGVRDFRCLFEINVFGVQRMIRAVLPAMRARADGLVLNISSLLGRVALPFYGPYNASKWALEAMSENYRAELSAFGVDVALVEPGGFPTRFIANLMQTSSRDRDQSYAEMAEAPKASLEGFEGFLAANPQQNPQLVADAVVAVIGARPGTRLFRTEVDRIGMAEPLKAYNDHLGQVTAGLFLNLGMADMLTLMTADNDVA